MLPPLLHGKGLTPLLDSQDFDHWQTIVGCTLGHHRSRLIGSGWPFRARLSCGQAGPFQLVHLCGQGALELERTQPQTHGVFWLPCQGFADERINGEPLRAEPGQALLMRPGDELLGTTTPRLEGVSILVPPEHLQPRLPALIGRFSHDQALIKAAQQLVAVAVGCGPGGPGGPGKPLAAATFLDALQTWQLHCEWLMTGHRERVTALKRHQYVVDALEWMQQHLGEPFEIAQVAAGVGVSVRTLQYACLQELGQTPMALAKRQRLSNLRLQLLNPELARYSIADLMGHNGLLACGSTAADYRRYCGESPRETRASRVA